jgi:endonuclease/exonuclease/phosphatase family metal-dependent hydrolase
MASPTLRVATFNIRHGRVGEHWPCLPWRLRAGIALCAADIVGLQEVDHRVLRSWRLDQTALAARAAGATDQVFAAARPFGPGGLYGNALLVRGTITSSATVELPPGGRPERRVAIVAEAEVSTGRVRAVVTHLQNHRDAALAQLRFLAAHLEAAHDARPLPTVVLGDLNLEPGAVAPVLGDAGFDLAGGPPSSDVEQPLRRIDHVAVRGFTVGEVEAPRPPVSDHRPIVASLQLTS